MASTTAIRNGSWWKRRTSMERCLTFTSALTFLIGVSLVIALAVILYSRNEHSDLSTIKPEALQGSTAAIIANALDCEPSSTESQHLCLTPTCVNSAAQVLQYMNESVNPCDDFYEFTCGKFLHDTSIPDDESSVTSFSKIGDKLEEQIKLILTEPILKTEPKPFQLAKKLYQACSNTTLIEDVGLGEVKNILKELGGWPVLVGKNWSEGDFDWRQSVYKFRKYGFSTDYFIDFSVGIDLKNSTRRMLDLDQTTLGLRREFLLKGLNDTIVDAYYKYMVDVAKIFGADKDLAADDLKKSLEFEIKLANISLPNEKRRNSSELYHVMTVEELQKRFPSIPWLEYFNSILSPDLQVTNKEEVNVNVPKFLDDFEALISRTPKRVQANYALWRVTASVVSYLTEELRSRQLKFSTVLTGRKKRQSRWKECVNVASGGFSIAVGALYVRRFFSEESRQNALEMVNDIRSQFITILQNVDWMDQKTKGNALDKAKSMTAHIAYPDELRDDNKITEFYDGLEIDANEYLNSILNMTRFGVSLSYRRLRLPVNKTDWITHGRPAVVNAFYSALENSIQFPAGILQGVFFDAKRPRYMNYGAIGFVIGHEITHGFDDQGRQFDKDGNLKEWWQPETKKAYLEKAQCIIHQYGNYTVPEVGLKLNGVNTQGENIADNGGLKEAYLAYRNWTIRNHVTEPRLPGLKYNARQMFWISAANTWCSVYRKEALRTRVLTGYHSPGRYRVNGPMSNLKYFAEDFKCQEHAKMNPPNKCSVW